MLQKSGKIEFDHIFSGSFLSEFPQVEILFLFQNFTRDTNQQMKAPAPSFAVQAISSSSLVGAYVLSNFWWVSLSIDIQILRWSSI